MSFTICLKYIKINFERSRFARKGKLIAKF